MKYIDVNVSLGNWPFRTFPEHTAAKLSASLKRVGIDKALVSSLDAVFLPDPAEANKKLIRQLKPYPNLRPVPVCNPTLPQWEKELESASAGSPVKILPNYHHYRLTSKAVDRFMEKAGENKNSILIQVRMEDERNQYPLLKVMGTKADDIVNLAKRFSDCTIVCLCTYFREAVDIVTRTGNVYTDTSFIEKLDTLPALFKKIPVPRVLFGSHVPFLCSDAAKNKIVLAGLKKTDRDAVASGNSRAILF